MVKATFSGNPEVQTVWWQVLSIFNDKIMLNWKFKLTQTSDGRLLLLYESESKMTRESRFNSHYLHCCLAFAAITQLCRTISPSYRRIVTRLDQYFKSWLNNNNTNNNNNVNVNSMVSWTMSDLGRDSTWHLRSVTSSGNITGCGSCSGEAASLKTNKYEDLQTTHLFVHIAIETPGCFNQTGLEFIVELGNRLKHVTGDKLELTYLFQRLSIAMQRDNKLCFNGTFLPRWYS